MVLTTSSESWDINESYRCGASSFVVKPSDYDGIVGFAELLEKYWFEVAVLPPKGEPC